MEANSGSSFCRKETADVVLRLTCTVSSLVGLMLMVKVKQSVIQSVGEVSLSTEIKYSDVTGLVYLLYSNGLVATYGFVIAATSVTLGSVRTHKTLSWIVFLLDQGLAYILLSAASASMEVAYLADKGDTKTSWANICGTYGHFCKLLRASTIASFVSVMALAALSVISARQLFGKYAKVKGVVKIKAMPES